MIALLIGVIDLPLLAATETNEIETAPQMALTERASLPPHHLLHI